MKLIIVESPTKAKTISKFLGHDYHILSSFGHVRDLPKRELGVDVENNFEPKYVVPIKAKKVITELKKEVKRADETILATDEDREGEAISWHLMEALKLKDSKRIVFHEITKSAIEEALENPRDIDFNLVNAQQARRVLDRIVGYKLSPFLWKKIAKGLSAGRVQSIAVRLVVDREREIKNFKPQEYWTIEALLNNNGKEFTAILIKHNETAIPKLGLKNEKETLEIISNLKDAEYIVKKVEKKEIKRNPLPPFTTSTLQQEAWKKLHFPAKLTMGVAQNLYERGYITYHRTDSVNLAKQSLVATQKFIENSYGNNYWPGFIREFKSKGRAQEAHEAIRPTDPNNNPETLDVEGNYKKLYDLIWKRFIACQMAPAIFDSVSADIEAKKENNNYTFRATGQTLKFDGFLKLYPLSFEQKELPALVESEKTELIKLTNLQHFTQPPSRYTEATLIRALEENGIGRPSTYAPTLSTIQARNYIEKDEQKRFIPAEIGTTVNDLLVEHFPEVVDIKFTAHMEEDLDDVAEGKIKWEEVCKEFYTPFFKNLTDKYEVVEKQEIDKLTDKICPDCRAPMIDKLGRFGRFYACSKFPECKHTESIKNNKLDIQCPKCGVGNLTEKRTKTKKIFFGCNKFPDCDFALWDKPLKEFCPECHSLLIETKKKQIKCSNKECRYIRKETK